MGILDFASEIEPMQFVQNDEKAKGFLPSPLA
jgi:hypothetical protein